MATSKQPHTRRQLTWVSLVLLLVSYTWFGWYLCGLQGRPVWLNAACYRLFSSPLQPPITAPQSLGETKPEAKPAENLRSPAVDAPKLEVDKASATKATPSPKVSHNSAPATEAKPVSAGSSTQTFCNAMNKYNLPAGVLAIGWVLISSLAFISPLTSFNNFIGHWFRSETVALGTVFLMAGLAAVVLYWLHIFLQILTILAVDILARIDIQYAGLTGIQAFWILTLISLTGLALGWTAHALTL